MGKIDSGEGGYSIGDELTTLTQLSLGNGLSFTQFANPLSSSAVLLDLECTTVGDYYEVWWSGESTDVKLDAVPAVTGSVTFPPNQPLSPSIILTVSYVG